MALTLIAVSFFHQDLSGVLKVPGESTPSYTAFVRNGDVQYGIMSSMDVLWKVDQDMVTIKYTFTLYFDAIKLVIFV